MTYRNPIIEWAMRNGMQLDRDRYLAICYPQGLPEPWTPEHEAELPEMFQEGFELTTRPQKGKRPRVARRARRAPAPLRLAHPSSRKRL
jgi:hypothetical protein